MERQLELEGLMVRHMNFSVRKALANKLDLDASVEGNDWRMLAEKLKYTFEDIMNLQVRQVTHGSNTMKLLEDHGLKSGSTVQNLWTQLDVIRRPDALEVIEKALPEIRTMQVEEAAALRAQTTHSNSSTCCHMVAHRNLRRHPSEPAYNHSYIGGHTEGYQHSGYVSPDQSSSCRSDHCSSDCGIHPFKRAESHPATSPVSHSTCRTCHNCCQRETTEQMTHSERSWHAGQPTHLHHNQLGAQRSTRKTSPVVRLQSVEDNNANVSLVVLAGTQVHARRENLMDIDSNKETYVYKDRPAPPENVHWRRVGLTDDNVPSLLQAVDMEVAAEEEVFTSSDSSTSTNSGNMGQGLAFQNPTQVLNNRHVCEPLSVHTAVPPRASDGHGHTPNSVSCPAHAAIPGQQYGADLHRRNDVFNNYHGGANNFIHSGGRESGPHHSHPDSFTSQQSRILSEEKTCEEKKVINTDHNMNTKEENSSSQRPELNVKPVHDTDKRCVTGTKVNQEVSLREPETSLKAGNLPRQEKSKSDPVVGSFRTISNGVTSQHSGAHISSGQQTVPGLNGGCTRRELDEGAAIGATGKLSCSMPQMKPSPFRTASRQVRVFVTYAEDNEKHVRRVLNLCDCLVKNGFSCSMDMKERELMNGDRMSWYDTRFRNADFVLLCISPMYKLQTESENGRSGALNMMDVDGHDQSLNTLYIYKLMQSEFTHNGYKNRRFVPLVFHGATKDHVPNWLKNTLIYTWPAQYKDLLWMMTKPQERICNSTS